MASKVVEVKLTEVEAVKELIADLTSRAERAEAERDEARWHQERCHRHHEASDAEAAELREILEQRIQAIIALTAEKDALRRQVDAVRALLAERKAGKFWYVRIADVLAALDGTEDTREADRG